MASNANEPPQPNPLLTAYESFQQNTPLVTRFILSVQTLSYLGSWIVDPQIALSCTPFFTIIHFEIYRIILSPLVNTSLISLILAFWSFQQHGTRLEYSMGSIAFAWLCLMLGCITNLIFILVSFVMYAITGSKTFLFAHSFGVWIILFGILGIECVRAPQGRTRRLFVADVPVLYYPAALYLVFAVMAWDFSLAYLISIGLGYLIGFASSSESGGGSPLALVGRHVERLVMHGSAKGKEWEESALLENIKQRQDGLWELHR
jgi:membrane associated rhomboid family serine protease